jgi:hypothetical protein
MTPRFLDDPDHSPLAQRANGLRRINTEVARHAPGLEPQERERVVAAGDAGGRTVSAAIDTRSRVVSGRPRSSTAVTVPTLATMNGLQVNTIPQGRGRRLS